MYKPVTVSVCSLVHPHLYQSNMKSYFALAALALMASTVKGGQILNSYNLISSPGLIVPQTYNSGFLQAPGIIAAPQQQQDLSHPAVVENAIAESQLPQDLLNPFYKNPTIAAGLAKESWFTNKEFPVHHREAEKIPRQRIFDIISRLQKRR